MTTTAAPEQAPPRSARRPAIAIVGSGAVAAAVAAVVITLQVTAGAYEPSTPGLPDPGPLVGWGLPVVRVLTDLAAALTVGWLIAAAFLDPPGRDGVVSRTGRADLMRAVGAAGVWAVLSLTQMFLTLGTVLGIPIERALDPQIVTTYAWELANTRSLALSAVVASVITIGALMTSSVGASAVWAALAVIGATLPALAGHGSGLGDHALALTAGVTHVAAAVVWLGGLIVLAIHGLRRDGAYAQPGTLRTAVTRFGQTALICVALLAVSGAANAYTRLDTAAQLLTTGYGQGVTAKVLLLVALALIAYVLRRRLAPSLDADRPRRAFLRVLAVEITLVAAAFGIGAALALSPYPRIESTFPTYGENLLGSFYPPAPTASGIVLGFEIEPLFFVGGMLAAALYVMGVIRLRSRGDRWPWGRTISWLLGIGVVIWTTNAGIALYAQVSAGLHMVQHMTMSMVGPMLLVLGGPFTLALRALRPSTGPSWGPREWIVWGLHSPIAKVVTNPFFVFVVFSLSMFGLYFTPAMAWLMGSHLTHVAMQVHFIASGYLFAWIVMGVDPVPRPLPYWARFGLVLVVLGVHGFFSVIVMMSSQPLAQEWYSVVRPDWVTDPVADTIFGGQVAWGISEIPMLFMVIILVFQWARSDNREARRKDRQAERDGDAELMAYNAYLSRLGTRGSPPRED